MSCLPSDDASTSRLSVHRYHRQTLLLLKHASDSNTSSVREADVFYRQCHSSCGPIHEEHVRTRHERSAKMLSFGHFQWDNIQPVGRPDQQLTVHPANCRMLACQHGFVVPTIKQQRRKGTMQMNDHWRNSISSETVPVQEHRLALSHGVRRNKTTVSYRRLPSTRMRATIKSAYSKASPIAAVYTSSISRTENVAASSSRADSQQPQFIIVLVNLLLPSRLLLGSPTRCTRQRPIGKINIHRELAQITVR